MMKHLSLTVLIPMLWACQGAAQKELVTGQQDEKASSNAAVERSVRALYSKDLYARFRSTDSFSKLDKSYLPMLRKSLKHTQDSKFKERLKMAIQAILCRDAYKNYRSGNVREALRTLAEAEAIDSPGATMESMLSATRSRLREKLFLNNPLPRFLQHQNIGRIMGCDEISGEFHVFEDPWVAGVLLEMFEEGAEGPPYHVRSILGSIGELAAPILLEALRSNKEVTKINAAQMLGFMGSCHPYIIDVLKEVRDGSTESDDVKLHAARAIENLWVLPPDLRKTDN